MEAPQDASGLTIPMVGVPVSIGRDLWQLISSTKDCQGGCGVSVRFGPDTAASLPSYEVGCLNGRPGGAAYGQPTLASRDRGRRGRVHVPRPSAGAGIACAGRSAHAHTRLPARLRTLLPSAPSVRRWTAASSLTSSRLVGGHDSGRGWGGGRGKRGARGRPAIACRALSHEAPARRVCSHRARRAVRAGDTRSASNQAQCGVLRRQGTSMSCPVVAGNLALIRQYFMDGCAAWPGRPTDRRSTVASLPHISAALFRQSCLAPSSSHVRASVRLEVFSLTCCPNRRRG